MKPEDDLLPLRQRARTLLDLSVPRDGLAAYYALYHDPARTRLWVEETGERNDGFLAVCQTGRDLFRPLVVLRARSTASARALIRRALVPGRPYYLVALPDLQAVIEETMRAEHVEMNRVYQLDLRRYVPAINVLVTPAQSVDGSPRFVIRSQDKVAAEAGINWRSPHFAEIYVWTEPEARERGWGKAVVDGCVAWVVRSGVQPLYIVAESNEPSIHLAESIGFVDTGARELAVEGTASADADAAAL